MRGGGLQIVLIWLSDSTYGVFRGTCGFPNRIYKAFGWYVRLSGSTCTVSGGMSGVRVAFIWVSGGM